MQLAKNMKNGILPNHFQVVEFLLQCGFSVSSKNNEGKTPLHTAAVKVMMIMMMMMMMMIMTITARARLGCKVRMRMRCECQEKVVSSWESDCLTPIPPVRQTRLGLLVRLTLTSRPKTHSSNPELGG